LDWIEECTVNICWRCKQNNSQTYQGQAVTGISKLSDRDSETEDMDEDISPDQSSQSELLVTLDSTVAQDSIVTPSSHVTQNLKNIQTQGTDPMVTQDVTQNPITRYDGSQSSDTIPEAWTLAATPNSEKPQQSVSSSLPTTPDTPHLFTIPAQCMMKMDWPNWELEPMEEWVQSAFNKDLIPEYFNEAYHAQFKSHLKDYEHYEALIQHWQKTYFQFHSTHSIFTSEEMKNWELHQYSKDLIPHFVLQYWIDMLGVNIQTENANVYRAQLMVLATSLLGYFEPLFVSFHQQSKAIKAAIQKPEPTPNKDKGKQPEQSKKPIKQSYAAVTSTDKPVMSPCGSDRIDSPNDDGYIPPLQETRCRITKKSMEGRKPPISDQPNTLWWDLQGLSVPQGVIRRRVKQETIRGWSYRKGQDWVELAYKTVKLRDEAINKEVSFPGYEATLTPIKARRIGGSEVFIELVNVPQSDGVDQDIREVFAEWGVISDIAPVVYVDDDDEDENEEYWSRRWNLILNIAEGTVLPIPPLFSIRKCEVAAFWQGSRKVCTICFTVGHYSQNCNPNYRAKSWQRRREALQPAQPIATDNQRIMAKAYKKVEETNLTLTEALVEVAKEQATQTKDVLESINKTADSLQAVAGSLTKEIPNTFEQILVQENQDRIVSRQEAEHDSQIRLAARGYAELPKQPPDEQAFVQVRSRKAILAEKKAEAERNRTNLPQPSQPLTPPRPTTPNNKHARSNPSTPNQGGQRKKTKFIETRSRLTQEACCQYFFTTLSRPPKEIAQIWALTPSEYSHYREAMDKTLYKNAVNWERRNERDGPITFDPREAGITIERGKSPPPAIPVETDSPSKAPEKGRAFANHQRARLPSTPTEKLKVSEPKKEIELRVSYENSKGAIEEKNVRIAMGSYIRDLKQVINKFLGRKDFMLVNQQYRLNGNERIGERLRNGNRVMVVGAWNVKDPQVRTTLPQARPVNENTKLRLRLSCEGKSKELQGEFSENTTGITVQEFVADALKLEAFEPIITHQGHYLDLNRSLKDQGIDGKAKLIVSSNVNMLIRIQYVTRKALATTTVTIPNNKLVIELKARIVNKIPILKDQAFDVFNVDQDQIRVDSPVNTVVKSGGMLAVGLKNNAAVDALDDEEMDTDSLPPNHIRIHYNDSTNTPVQADLEFTPEGSTGKDLKEHIEAFMSHDEKLDGRPFVMKFEFHLVKLNEPLDHWSKKSLPLEIIWGEDYSSASTSVIVV
jgi:hypothetical protein